MVGAVNPVAPVTVGDKILGIGSTIVTTLKDHVVFLGQMLTTTENLDKVAKLACAALDVVTLVADCEGAKVLRGRIKDMRAVLVVSQIVFRIKEWLFNKKGSNSPFWKTDSKLTVAAHAVFTAGQVVEIVQTIEKFGLLTLGVLSKTTGLYTFFGGLITTSFPLISIFRDVLYMTSALMQVVDKALVVFDCGKKTNRHTFKIGKWEEHAQLIQNAFPAVTKKDPDDENGPAAQPSKEAQDSLKRRYEARICATQIEMQHEILGYIAAKHGQQLSYSGIEPFNLRDPKVLQVEYVHHAIKTLKRMTQDILSNKPGNSMGYYCALLAQLQQGLKHLEFSSQLTDKERVKMRNSVLDLNSSLHELTTGLAKQDFDPRYEQAHPELLAKVKKIDKLYEKLTELQRSYSIIAKKNSTGLAEVYKVVEWKKAKWEAREYNNQLQEKKAWFMIVDMVCKIVGSVMSLICTFVPLLALGKVALQVGGTIAENISPEVAALVNFVRGLGMEAFKVGLAVFSAFATIHFTKETAGNKGMPRAIPARPETQKVKGLPNPLKKKSKAMEVLVDIVGQPQVEAKDLRAILKLVHSVQCGTVKVNNTDYFRISAACAA